MAGVFYVDENAVLELDEDAVGLLEWPANGLGELDDDDRSESPIIFNSPPASPPMAADRGPIQVPEVSSTCGPPPYETDTEILIGGVNIVNIFPVQIPIITSESMERWMVGGRGEEEEEEGMEEGGEEEEEEDVNELGLVFIDL